MDFKLPELWFNFIGLFKKGSHKKLVEYYKKNEQRARNHGEGGLYSMSVPSAAAINEAHQQQYEKQARAEFNKLAWDFRSEKECIGTKERARLDVLNPLGDALHVAQDRGAHGGGAEGWGHDAKSFKCDDSSSNTIGLAEARVNTARVLKSAEDMLYRIFDRVIRFTAYKGPAEVHTIRRYVSMEPDSAQFYHRRDTGHIQMKMNLNTPGDIYEQEADRVAEVATRTPDHKIQRQEEKEEPVTVNRVSEIQCQEEEELQEKPTSEVQRQKGIPGTPEKPPKTTSDPKEVLGKVLEGVMKTEKGKEVTKKLKKATTSEEGIAVLSMLAVPTLAAAFAEKMEVPQGVVNLVPKIAKVELGKDIEIAFQPIYKGKLGKKLKEWGGMVTLTIKRW